MDENGVKEITMLCTFSNCQALPNFQALPNQLGTDNFKMKQAAIK
jgi:hypothetical protein